MKTKEEIEQLAAREYWNTNTESRSFIKGYTQCQEDMADKKYTKEDIINIVNKSRETGLTAEYLMLSLNKQD